MSKGNTPAPVIIKKRRNGHHDEHHGGAWKIAYADFVTAMMALFLLLWLINITTDEQRDGIANYFNPVSFDASSGGDGLLEGRAIAADGKEQTERAGDSGEAGIMRPQTAADEAARAKAAAEEQASFERVREEITERLSAAVDLKELAENLIIEETEEGLRIQITDRGKVSMFAVGSAEINAAGQRLVRIIGEAISDIPNQITVSGHTDSLQFAPGASYGNWELSAERANAARRGIVAAGTAEDRLVRVEGRADADHLFPDTPEDPRNRRIGITLLRRVPNS